MVCKGMSSLKMLERRDYVEKVLPRTSPRGSCRQPIIDPDESNFVKSGFSSPAPVSSLVPHKIQLLERFPCKLNVERIV